MQTETDKTVAPHLAALCWFSIALVIIYALPLVNLLQYALGSHLYSHILLVPLVTVYLTYLKRVELAEAEVGTAPAAAGLFALAGVACLSLYMVMVHSGLNPVDNDAISMSVFSFVSLFLSGFLFFMGRDKFAAVAFPLCFLFFMVPLPVMVESAFEKILQVGSSYCFAGLLTLSRTPFFRDGMTFNLPGLTLEVATECSGIRSTLVLFITSLLAGYMFLRSPWRRLVLASLFLPIALLRNGLRILTIALGTIYVDPTIIDGPVHRKGGPPFFVISLIPLFLALWLLLKNEKRRSQSVDGDAGEKE